MQSVDMFRVPQWPILDHIGMSSSTAVPKEVDYVYIVRLGLLLSRAS